MCEWGNTTAVIIGGRLREIDSCIAPLVAALNAGGIPTVASCCGHGHQTGNVALADGRYLVVFPDGATWEAYETGQPVDIHGNPRR